MIGKIYQDICTWCNSNLSLNDFSAVKSIRFLEDCYYPLNYAYVSFEIFDYSCKSLQ